MEPVVLEMRVELAPKQQRDEADQRQGHGEDTGSYPGT
jgi:hypothetical protein